MTDKVKALELAERLDAEIQRTVELDMLHHNAAAELRRQHKNHIKAWDVIHSQGVELIALRKQRNDLLEALRDIGEYRGEGLSYTTPWQDIVGNLGEKARAAITKAEKENQP